MTSDLETKLLEMLKSLNVAYDWREPLGELLIYNFNGVEYHITIDSYNLSPEEIAAITAEKCDEFNKFSE